MVGVRHYLYRFPTAGVKACGEHYAEAVVPPAPAPAAATAPQSIEESLRRLMVVHAVLKPLEKTEDALKEVVKNYMLVHSHGGTQRIDGSCGHVELRDVRQYETSDHHIPSDLARAYRQAEAAARLTSTTFYLYLHPNCALEAGGVVTALELSRSLGV